MRRFDDAYEMRSIKPWGAVLLACRARFFEDSGFGRVHGRYLTSEVDAARLGGGVGGDYSPEE